MYKGIMYKDSKFKIKSPTDSPKNAWDPTKNLFCAGSKKKSPSLFPMLFFFESCPGHEKKIPETLRSRSPRTLRIIVAARSPNNKNPRREGNGSIEDP